MSLPLLRHPLTRQVVRFGIVGLVNTATTYLVIWLLRSGLHAPVWLASAGGYAVGTVQSYLLSRNWTFAGTPHAAMAPQAAAFVGVNLLCMAVFSGLSVLLDRTMPLPQATVLATLLVLPLSFSLYRWFVFRTPREVPQ